MANYDWLTFLNKSKKYIMDDLNIKLEIKPYEHHTKFTATDVDIILYFIYLENKYKTLYIPNKLSNIKEGNENFPFFINYDTIDESIEMHPDINIMINKVRREKQYTHGLLFLGLTLENDLKHANILLYDFKNLTLERFEPYGNDGIINPMDEILEEELTWNTGFKYLKPNDFMPKPGYQLLSNENDLLKLKSGDFGGFCLGWCIWYVEHRLKNSNIDPKTLNKKTMEKMLRLDDSFTEYIRNYSNKLFNEKFKIAQNICFKQECISKKNISNINISKDDEQKIIIYAKQYFGIT